MKNKIIHWLFYHFFQKLLEEYFEIDVYLFATNFDKKITMIHPPANDTIIELEEGYFLVKSIISSPHGSVLKVTGSFTKTKR